MFLCRYIVCIYNIQIWMPVEYRASKLKLWSQLSGVWNCAFVLSCITEWTSCKSIMYYWLYSVYTIFECLWNTRHWNSNCGHVWVEFEPMWFGLCYRVLLSEHLVRVFLNQFHQKNLGGSAVLLGTVVFGESPSHPKRLVGRQFTKQYLIFNAHLRHARQILVGGDNCKPTI